MRENPLAAGAPPRTRSLQRSTDPLARGLKNPTSALGPSGLQPWPRSLPPQIRLPKYTYVVN